MATTKPDFNRIFAKDADPANIDDPDNTQAGKFALGWLAEFPPFQWFNFIQNLFSLRHSYSNENAWHEWDADTDYPISGTCRVGNTFYVSEANPNKGNNPSAAPNNFWSILDVKTFYNAAKTYGIGGKCTFNGTEYTSKVANNIGNTPNTSPDQWDPPLNGEVPIKSYLPFSGTLSDIPSNWRLVDGGASTPDIRDRILVSIGATYSQGQIGGNNVATTSLNGAFTPYITVNYRSLTSAQIPSHYHFTVKNAGGTGTLSSSNSLNVYSKLTGTTSLDYQLKGNSTGANIGRSSSVGSGSGHNHTATSTSAAAHSHTVDTRSPYYATAFIMRMS